jgi:hypothetical protein
MTPEQEIIVDVTLASAISAHAGNVWILLPVLRPHVQELWAESQENFVSRILEFVKRCRDDPAYRMAFVRNGPALLPQVSPEASGLIASSRARRERMAFALRAILRRWWTALAAPALWIVTPSATVDAPVETQPEPQPDPAPIVEPAIASCGQTVKVPLVVTTRCVAGRQVDEDDIDRGICPNCLGRARVVA